MESRRDRSDRRAGASGDLVDRQVPEEPQRDHDPMVRRQPAQGCPELVAIVDAAHRVAIRRSDVDSVHRLRGQVDNRPPGRLAESIPAHVHKDPIEPGPEALSVAKLAPVTPGLDERIVRCVLGFAWLPRIARANR